MCVIVAYLPLFVVICFFVAMPDARVRVYAWHLVFGQILVEFRRARPTSMHASTSY